MFRNPFLTVFVFQSQNIASLQSCLTFSCSLGLINVFSGCLSVVSLSPQEANQFLSRHRRANQVFEETKQGHLERECVEERCTKEEAREVFENDPETVSMSCVGGTS